MLPDDPDREVVSTQTGGTDGLVGLLSSLMCSRLCILVTSTDSTVDMILQTCSVVKKSTWLCPSSRGGYRSVKLQILFVLEHFLLLWHTLRIFIKKKL